MSEKEEDYSDYISYLSNLLLVWSLFSGFIFTAITLLLTLLPDPSQILIQVTLFFLAVFLNIILFLSMYDLGNILYLVENIPPETKGLGSRKATNLLTVVSFLLFGVVVELMFLHWNLIYLALASGVVYAFFVILTLIIIVKPSWEYLRKMRTRRRS